MLLYGMKDDTAVKFDMNPLFVSMKTPAFMYLPRREFLSPFPRQTSMTSHDLILWRHDVNFDVHILASPYIIWDRPNQKTMEIHFLTSWPWPLTYDLDHWTSPRFYLGQCAHRFSSPYLKRFSHESAKLQTHIHRWDRFYYLDRWRRR